MYPIDSKKAVFLDRDGVINKDINYLYKIDDFKFINNIFHSCRYFNSLDYQIIIVSNQSGIARGYYNENDFNKLTQWMLQQFLDNNIRILDVLYCPHGPDSICECRKPKPGMFDQAKIKHNIDVRHSWAIGDQEIDIQAANAAGIHNTILVNSSNLTNRFRSNAKFFIDSIKHATKIIVH